MKRAWCATLLSLAGAPAFAQQFSYPDFSSTSGLTLLGHAATSGTELRLTPPVKGQGAAVWRDAKVRVRRGFTTNFQFRISEAGGVPDWFGMLGADGFAFVIQNDTPTSIGTGGSGMCYEGISNSIAIEFDTWGHPFFGDPDSNHTSVQTQGVNPNTYTAAASLGLSQTIPELSSNTVMTATITCANNVLKVFIDGVEHLSVNVNLSTLLNLDNGTAWVGFTSSTGGAFEAHDLLSWDFSSVCYPDCNGCGCLTIAQFACFQASFVAQNPYADCNLDGAFTISDFGCFQSEFVAGCN